MKRLIRPLHKRWQRGVAAVELADLNTGGDPPVIIASCGDGTCTPLNVPTATRGRVEMRVHDNLFSGLTYLLSGDDGIYLKATVQVAYAGQ